MVRRNFIATWMSLCACFLFIAMSFNPLVLGEIDNSNTLSSDNQELTTSDHVEINIIPRNVQYLQTEKIFRIYNIKVPSVIELEINIQNKDKKSYNDIEINLTGDTIQKINDKIHVNILQKEEIKTEILSFIVTKNDAYQYITVESSMDNGVIKSQEIEIYSWIDINACSGEKDIVHIRFTDLNYLENFHDIPGLEDTILLMRTFHKDNPEWDWLTIRFFENYNDFAIRILSRKEIKWIEPGFGPMDLDAGGAYIPNDPEYQVYSPPGDPGQWGLKDINAQNAWNYRLGRTNVVVAIIDSGIWTNGGNYPAHPDLIYGGIPGCDETYGSGLNWGCIIPEWPQYKEYPNDEHDHGTAVASVIAGEIDNNIGMAGVANISYMPIKVLVSRGGEALFPATWSKEDMNLHVSHAIKYAYEHGANIISMSFNIDDLYPTMKDELQNAWTKGCVLVASSGNGLVIGEEITTYPAGVPNVLAVGAVTKNWQNGQILKWDKSRYGLYMGVVAPGDMIWAASPNQYPGLLYQYWAGTSFATPFVSGTAALMLAVNPSLSNKDIVGVIKSTSRPTNDYWSTWDKHIGWGEIDTGAAVQKAFNLMNISGSVRLTNYIGTSTYPSVKLYNDNIFIVWLDSRNYADSRCELYLRKINQDGYPLEITSGVYEVRLTTYGSHKYYPSIDIDTTGDIWVFWFDDRNSVSYPQLFFQRYSPTGVPRYTNDIQILNIPYNQVFDPASFYIWGPTPMAYVVLSYSYTSGGVQNCIVRYMQISNSGGIYYNTVLRSQSGSTACVVAMPHPVIKKDKVVEGSYLHISFLIWYRISPDSGYRDYYIEYMKTNTNGQYTCPQCLHYYPEVNSYMEEFNLIYDMDIDSYNHPNFIYFGRNTAVSKWIFMYTSNSDSPANTHDVEIVTDVYPAHTTATYDYAFNLKLLIESNNAIHYFSVAKYGKISYREITYHYTPGSNIGYYNSTAAIRSDWLSTSGTQLAAVLGTSVKFFVFWSDSRAGATNTEIYLVKYATYWTQSETRISFTGLESYSPVSLGDNAGNIHNLWIEHSGSYYTISYKIFPPSGSPITYAIDNACINNNVAKYSLAAALNYHFAGSATIYLTWVQYNNIYFAVIQANYQSVICRQIAENIGNNDGYSEGVPDIAAGYDNVYIIYERNLGINYACPGSGGQFPINYDISLSIYQWASSPPEKKGITIANDACPQTSPKIITDSLMLHKEEITSGTGTGISKLYVTYINKTNDPVHIAGEVYYQTRRESDGNPLSAHKQITTYTSGRVYSVDLAIDPFSIKKTGGLSYSIFDGMAINNGWHGLKINLFWSQGSYPYSIYYTKINPADGSTPRDYSEGVRVLVSGLQWVPYGLSISTDNSARFFVVYYLDSLTAQDLGVINVNGRGGVYEAVKYLGNGNYVRTNPSITTDAYGQVFISFEKNSGTAREMDYVRTMTRGDY